MTLSQKLYSFGPIARAILVVGAVMVLVTGITFAQLNDSSTLEDNSLTSATAGLLINSDDGKNFAETDKGFAFQELAPGKESERHEFWLKNDGELNLDVTVYATNSDSDGIINYDKVWFCFEKANTTDEECHTYNQMMDSFNDLPGNSLQQSGNQKYEVYIKVDQDHPGSGFSVEPFDLVFTGEQVINPGDEALD